MRGSWYEQHYARCGPRYVRTEPDKRAKVCWSARLRALPENCGIYLPPARLLLPCPCFPNAAHMPHICIPACAHLPHVLILVITVRRISPRHGPPPKASVWCRHPPWRWPRCLSGRASHVALPRLFMRRGQWQLAISVCIGANSPSAVVSVLSTSCCRTRSGFFCAPISLRRTSTAGVSHAACHVATHACFCACLLLCGAQQCLIPRGYAHACLITACV